MTDSSKRLLISLATIVVAAMSMARHGRAQPPAVSASASSSAPTASASGVPMPPPQPSAEPEVTPKVQLLLATRRKIDAFLKRELEVGVDPRTLFDVDIDDAQTVAVEARRLAAVLERASRDAEQQRAAPDAPEHPPPATSTSAGVAAPPAPASADPSVSAPPPPAPDYAQLRRTDEVMWRARVELDEARLRFYRLDDDERAALLEAHAARQEADRSSKAEQAIAEADRDAEEAEKEKQAALEAAKKARSEAERAVHEEYARLLGITKQQAEFSKSLSTSEAANQGRNDEALGQRRRITEAIAQQRKGARDEVAMDLMYGQLRKRLKAARSLLGAAIDEVASDASGVPSAGADPLGQLPGDIDRSQIDAERAQIDKEALQLQARESAQRHERARLLMAEVELLNRARLAMLPFLSGAKRNDATGFGPEGLDHARAETMQVWLTVRYHLHATELWVEAIRSGDGRGSSAWTATLIALKWLLPILLFVTWRRRAERVLDNWRKSIRETTKKRSRRDTPSMSRALRVLSFVVRVRKPFEWLVLLWAVLWLLPESMRELLEVELVFTIFTWTLGGSLVVRVIDALSSDDVLGQRRAASATQTAMIRLRSLSLIGRAVVTVGLMLSLSNKLVGKGTIYKWVLSTCWFAALPILLVIVAWWRPVIFERIELIRKKGRLSKWVLANSDGAMSFLAALAGGAFLFSTGAWRVARGWVVTFNFTRRVLAYLFRRDMSKKASEGETRTYGAIDAETFRRLGPEARSDEIVPSVADAQVEQVIDRIAAPGGGIFAIVGERGAGKTTVADRIAESSSEVIYLDCPMGGIDAFQRALADVLSLDPGTAPDEAAKELDARGGDVAIIVDDAHHLILPMMEGLRDFDAVLELARARSEACTWIFAIDEVVWRLLQRLRGAKPLFDDVIHLAPWTEEGIVRLLTHRSDVVGVDAVFDALLEELPEDADEIDRLEALQRTEASYYRLLWDYAGGNPGVALHFWRKSLGIADNEAVHVRLFSAPDAEDLQGLPDSTVFVLRAIVQLDKGTFEQICTATSLPPAEVKDALRYGTVRGYFQRDADRFHITWAWFRAITRFLRRRHLLFAGSA